VRKFGKRVKRIPPEQVVYNPAYELNFGDKEKIAAMTKWLIEHPDKDFPPILITTTYKGVGTANGGHRHIAYLRAKEN